MRNTLFTKVQELSRRLKAAKSIMRQRLRVIDRQFSIIILLLSSLCLLTLPIVFRPTQKEKATISFMEDEFSEETTETETGTETETEPEADVTTETQSEPSTETEGEGFETVHEDLGDEPVEAQTELSLEELEKRAVLGELTVTERTMKKGESLLGILAEQNIPSKERMEIVDALELLLDLKSLKPGLTFLFFHTPEKQLEGLSIRQKANESLAVLREKDGSWVTFSQTGRVETKQEHIQVTIERTFSGSAQKAGVPSNIINQVTAALENEFDFTTNIKPNDTVDLILESKVTQGGLEIGTKQLLYIGVKTPSVDIHKYAYNGTFYDAKGRTAEITLMKRPLKARPRLSSPFGKRRHPILQYEIFHKGVDLAVPKNTPVMAAADGTIELIGRKGSYGKYIRIGHKGGYQTAYAHLNGYRQDLKVGSRVKRGDVIAYVGTTGRSTGPHLHFEVIKNGKVVNPLGNNRITSSQLSGFELEKFQSWAESIHPDFRQHLAGKVPPVPPKKPF